MINNSNGIEGGIGKATETKKESEFITRMNEKIKEDGFFLSKKLREDVTDSLLLIDNLNGNEKGKLELADLIIEMKKKPYEDSRDIFSEKGIGHSVYNKRFIKELSNELIQNGKLNILRVYVDVEALKMVNDVTNHERGDKYLATVYEVLGKVAEDFKKEYDKNDELKYYISAEGGDEFGIFFVGEEDGDIDLGKECISMNKESGNEEKSKVSVGQVIASDINEKLSEVKGSDLISNQEIIENIIKNINKETETSSEQLANATGQSDDIIGVLLSRFKDNDEIQRLAKDKNISEENFKVLKEKLFDCLEERQKERVDAVTRKFENYEFFASASVGFCSLAEEFDKNDKDVIEITEKINEQGEKDNIKGRDKKALANQALFELLLVKSDKRMKENKKLFKSQLRNLASIIGSERSNEERDIIIQNLLNHSEVFTRTEESAEIQREHNKIQKEMNIYKQRVINSMERLQQKISKIEQNFEKRILKMIESGKNDVAQLNELAKDHKNGIKELKDEIAELQSDLEELRSKP